MFSVSYYFKPDTPLSDFEVNSSHPHRVLNGGGSGCANDYPDELWARAQQRYAELLLFAQNCQNKPTVRFEWKKGWPAGYVVCEGSFCSLDGHPDEISMPIIPSDKTPRVRIES
ncbi:hypothetical protein ACH518_00040 (plasmid) [Methylomonas sp. HW2-6]|uniref:hypothetical protein n=1 Tax=Methylomonas sp. HW2-6 TaxID=3376687 RepID=UPI004041AF85